MRSVTFTLSFSGNYADNNVIDLYDAGQALIGFHRSLAITTHLILNNEIITHAPALRNAKILSKPASEGSWKAMAVVAGIGTSIMQINNAPKDSPIGNLVRSAYDYVISESLGFHVDYDKNLFEQFEDAKKKKLIENNFDQNRLDSVVEKCQSSIKDMHRPISKSETASNAEILFISQYGERPVGPPLTKNTYDYIDYTERRESAKKFIGYVASYNINTFKGRVYLFEHNRPIPFELAPNCRLLPNIIAITSSLSGNAVERLKSSNTVEFFADENLSKSGQLKSLYVLAFVLNGGTLSPPTFRTS